MILQCAPPPGEWELFRRARPDTLRLLVEADEHFLAGRRDEGMSLLFRLFQERGVGQATLCRRLGGAWLGEGKLKEAGECLQQVVGADGRLPADVTRTLTSLSSSTTEPAGVARSGDRATTELDNGAGSRGTVRRPPRCGTVS